MKGNQTEEHVHFLTLKSAAKEMWTLKSMQELRLQMFERRMVKTADCCSKKTMETNPIYKMVIYFPSFLQLLMHTVV